MKGVSLFSRLFICPSVSLTVSGMGFGVIAGVVTFANILKLSGGPAVVGVNDGGSEYFVLSSGE